MGFFGVFRSTIRRFEILPKDADDAQTHRIATQTNAHGVATIKEALLWKKIEIWVKNRQKRGFSGYSGLN